MTNRLREEVGAVHAIYATYAGGPGEPYFQPQIDCECGFSTGRCESWEDAGRQYDEHLKAGEKR